MISETSAQDTGPTTLERLSASAPRPSGFEATGLSLDLLGDLVLRHILRAGALSAAALAERLGLVGAVIEPVVQMLRQEALVQFNTRIGVDKDMRLTLTDRGRQSAKDSLERCGYVGPAPLPLTTYVRIVREQGMPRRSLGREHIRQRFSDIVMSNELSDRLGVALTAGRALFLYGPPGTGKTHIASRLIDAFPGEVLIPHAIVVNDKIIRIYDPTVHERIELREGNRGFLHAQSYDARFVLCQRPMILAGGELTLDMLEVRFDAPSGEYYAPLQMKANGGILVIDDLGRQSFVVQRLFDRWIIPLEQQVDRFAAGADTVFVTPCDPLIVFSTNMEPADLADEAVLRRLGYKIEFGALSPALYARIWAGVCAESRLEFDRSVLEYVVTQLYPKSGRALLACHPRDLIRMALDKATYDERPGSLTPEDLQWAWSNYFITEQF